MAPESMVLGRAKRSTAGNRLRALLDKAHTLNAEEGFEEVEDDQDFEDHLDQKDVFDSDFASTDDEAADSLDPATLEKRLRREERTEKKKERKKGYHDPLAYLKKGPRTKIKSTKTATVDRAAVGGAQEQEVQDQEEGEEAEEEPEEEETSRKRRRVTFPDEQPSSLSSPVPAEVNPEREDAGSPIEIKPSGRRGGLGRKTVQGEVRRSALRESTRKDREGVDEREKEEEARRADHPLRGPRKPHPNKQLTQADLIALALEREEENRESLKDWLKKEEERRVKAREGRKGVEGPRLRWISRAEGVGEIREVDGEDGGMIVVQPRKSAGPVTPPKGLTGVPEKIETIDPPMASSSSPSKTILQEEKSDSPPARSPEKPASGPKLDVSTPAEGSPEGPYTRNYLVLEEVGGLKAQMEVVFGDHVDWTKVPVVSIRNRVQTRRKPVCPLTGRPASYRHPATHVSYASTGAYRAIENVLQGAYRWSADHGAFLDFEGTDDDFEVADGLMDEVIGWKEAYRRHRREPSGEVEMIVVGDGDGGSGDPPRSDDPMKGRGIDLVTPEVSALTVKREEAASKSKSRANVSKRKRKT